MVVKSRSENDAGSVSLMKIVSELKNRGMEVPVLLRFSNILRDQITRINHSFQKAIADAGYKGDYRGVYPIKVNQQEQVLEDVTRFGKPFHYGLEAGSKPELMAAISLLDDPEACLICNGYKDKEFIDLGLYAIKMGMKCFFVVEMAGELQLILERAEKLGVEPLLGVRLKLASQAGGRLVGIRRGSERLWAQFRTGIGHGGPAEGGGEAALSEAAALSSWVADSEYSGYPGCGDRASSRIYAGLVEEGGRDGLPGYGRGDGGRL